MKNKTGKLTGFVAGVAGFLLLFKLFFISNVPPSDELAPGIVVIFAVLNGLLFAWLGNWMQNSLQKKKS